jgi:hypothetical protein
VESAGMPPVGKYKEFTNDWNYDTTYICITSGFRRRKFSVPDFCCTVYLQHYMGKAALKALNHVKFGHMHVFNFYLTFSFLE